MQLRVAGVLLHPTSLPNKVLDREAWKFIDWMVDAGLKVWQLLPITAPHNDLSPYNSISAFALNPNLLPNNWESYYDESEFSIFLEDEPHWLHDYALFMVLRNLYQDRVWSSWEDKYKCRDTLALDALCQTHKEQILEIKKQQFVLLKIWRELREYANSKGINLFGDMPIFVSYDSADVWANPQQFRLDKDMQPSVVTGVPPDYFSETGQRWGNPHYNWEVMEADNFCWWCLRVEESLKLFDLVRIDHFRGLEASWEIDASEPTAINGTWVKAPGKELLARLQEAFPDLPLVAEDLGIITPEVVDLKESFNLPGMSVLQFGFSGLPDNPHAPSELVENSVVYTGTHDNDTSCGWFESLDEGTQEWVLSQLDREAGNMPWPLIATAFRSPAQRVIIPVQDFLGLGAEHRMNVPGTTEGNWGWKLEENQLSYELAHRINLLVSETGR